MTSTDGLVVREPAPGLRGLVTPYHGYRFTALEPGVHRGLPGTGVTVVLAFDHPLDVAWAYDEGTRVHQWATVAGLHDGPALIRHEGHQYGVQFDLTPGGCRVLLGVPASALRASLVSLSDLLPRDRTHERLVSAESWAERFEILDRALLLWAETRPPIRAELARAWTLVHRDPTLRVAELATAVGWSRRHLTEAFTAEYGVGPKQAARIVRFKRARDLVADGNPLARVAADLGYADQAHLSREWRDLADCTPTEWIRTELPFLQAEQVDLLTG